MFYEQLNRLCKENNTTPTAFVTEKLGLSSSKITAWKGGSIPKYGVLKKIADYFHVTVSFLFAEDKDFLGIDLEDREQDLLSIFKKLDEYDKGKVFSKAETLAEIAAERAAEQAKKEEETAQSSADPRPDPQKPLPFPTEPEQDEEEKFYVDICSLPASAGTGVYLDDSSTEPLQIVHTDIAERANYAVRVSGDSMMPEYNDGDIVLVETCRSVEVGEIGIFVVDGEGYIKKYGGDRLISLNSKYKDMLLKRYEAVYCRGRVLGIAEVVD